MVGIMDSYLAQQIATTLRLLVGIGLFVSIVIQVRRMMKGGRDDR